MTPLDTWNTYKIKAKQFFTKDRCISSLLYFWIIIVLIGAYLNVRMHQYYAAYWEGGFGMLAIVYVWYRRTALGIITTQIETIKAQLAYIQNLHTSPPGGYPGGFSPQQMLLFGRWLVWVKGPTRNDNDTITAADITEWLKYHNKLVEIIDDELKSKDIHAQ